METTDQLIIVEQLVLQERKIVTYGWLSRYLNIHANKAKQLLYKFISSKENGVHAIYCICGLTANNSQHTVTLVTQEKLEVARKGFIRLTSLHVYSVQPECPTEANLIKAGREPIDKVASESANKDAPSVTSTLASQPNTSITSEKAVEMKPTKGNVSSSEKSIMTIKITEKKQNSDKASSDIASLFNKAASQNESKTSNKKEKKRKSDEVESNHNGEFGISKEEQTAKKSKKQIISKQKNDKDSDITSPLNKAVSQDECKISNKKSKKRKSNEAVDELDVEISEEEKATNKQKNGKGTPLNKADSKNKITTKDKVVKKRKNNKVADDLHQEAEASKIKQISNERREDQSDITSLLNKAEQLDINNDEKDLSQDKPSPTLVRSDQQNALPTVLQKKRGRRQILKSRSFVNERGYTVHENYHEWESFSEDESVSERFAKKPQKTIKAKEPIATAKRGKNKGDNGSQKSLLSFFGRK
ncbi:DNA polymerase subunit Cdc27 [Glomus cerebriforme]|uniref:DNA polymerase delta subunit 3 n=1 Tax=Glomus cerebriforme TaxID=658196 RepID=A0A397TKN2_9GLOM|nr:DNA polymerase subunit Cdc27 [Glomus cerebriforme]